MDATATHQRTMKDFLELYNRLVHHCFERCVSNFNHGKTSAEEMGCINTCADKVINFNQRHMMVFVEHQNTKQKLAAKAAESQAAAETVQLPTAAAATVSDQIKDTAIVPPAPAVQEQNSSTLAQVATTLVGQGDGPAVDGPAVKEAVPENVCGHAGNTVAAHLRSLKLDSCVYPGKSIVDMFLDSGADDFKFV